ncbi:hypothetical protein E2542_SST11076 [Spatholobus suberectus]|nr:hypothetical protein E2542_SST11076 [Spatholobus suberectus]
MGGKDADLAGFVWCKPVWELVQFVFIIELLIWIGWNPSRNTPFHHHNSLPIQKHSSDLLIKMNIENSPLGDIAKAIGGTSLTKFSPTYVFDFKFGAEELTVEVKSLAWRSNPTKQLSPAWTFNYCIKLWL